MKLVCKHDPHNPDHLVCGAKWSRIDIVLLAGAVILVMGSLIFLVQRKKELPARQDFSKESLNRQAESQQYSGQSDLYLESEALYFSKEGEQIGRGPWPLEAGKETRIKVFLKLVARPQDVGGLATVTGKLGPNTQWTGFVPIGKGIAYEPEARTMRWKPTKLSSVESDTAVFELAITPFSAQIQEAHLVVMDTMTILVRNTSGEIITKILTPDILLFLK